MDRIPFLTLKGRKYTYTLEPEPFNNGAISKVFLGINNQTNEQVAIKEVLQITFKGKQINLYFDQELQLSKYLKSKRKPLRHVVQIYDIVESQDKKSFYVVMEYFDEGDFSNFIQNFQDPSKFMYLPTIALHIAQGIKELHDLNIIHRDIKPSNIFGKKKGDKYYFKIGDFGLCKLLQEENNQPNTSKQSIVGTINYMAPELFSQYYDKKIDVWSFGCLLYEASRGTQLFKLNYGSSYNDILRLIQGFRRFNSRDSNDFIGQIIQACLVSAEKRPEMGEILNLIKDYQRRNNENTIFQTQMISAQQTLNSSYLNTCSTDSQTWSLNRQVQNPQAENEIITETVIVIKYPQEAQLQEFLNTTVGSEKQPFIQTSFNTENPQRFFCNSVIGDPSKRYLDEKALLYTMNESIMVVKVQDLYKILNDGGNYSEITEKVALYRDVFPIIIKNIFEINDLCDSKSEEASDMFPFKISKMVIRELKDNFKALRILNMFRYKKFYFRDNSFMYSRDFLVLSNRSLEYHLFIQALVNVIYDQEKAESCFIYLLIMASKLIDGDGQNNKRYPRLCILFHLILNKLEQTGFKNTQKVIECLKQSLLFNGLNSEISSFAKAHFPLSEKGTDFLGQKFKRIDLTSLDSLDVRQLELEIESQIRKGEIKTFTTIVYCLRGNEGKIFLSQKQANIIFSLIDSTSNPSLSQILPKSQQKFSNPLNFRY